MFNGVPTGYVLRVEGPGDKGGGIGRGPSRQVLIQSVRNATNSTKVLLLFAFLKGYNRPTFQFGKVFNSVSFYAFLRHAFNANSYYGDRIYLIWSNPLIGYLTKKAIIAARELKLCRRSRSSEFDIGIGYVVRMTVDGTNWRLMPCKSYEWYFHFNALTGTGRVESDQTAVKNDRARFVEWMRILESAGFLFNAEVRTTS